MWQRACRCIRDIFTSTVPSELLTWRPEVHTIGVPTPDSTPIHSPSLPPAHRHSIDNVSCNTFTETSSGDTVGGRSSGLVKSSLKHTTSFRVISSNQKLPRVLTNARRAIAQTNSSCCLATSGSNTAGSVSSQRRMSSSIGTYSPAD